MEIATLVHELLEDKLLEKERLIEQDILVEKIFEETLLYSIFIKYLHEFASLKNPAGRAALQ